jgi:hypothetical protein
MPEELASLIKQESAKWADVGQSRVFRQTPPSSREAARGGVRELVEKHGSGSRTIIGTRSSRKAIEPRCFPGQFFEVSSFSASGRWGSIADRAVPSAATPAATAACLATRFSFDLLGRLDFFDFVGRLVVVCLRAFDLAATRFDLFFDLTRRFDEVLDLARFFAFFMISPFDSI